MNEGPVLELRVALTARDFERMERFYRHGLGIEPFASWPAEQGRALVLDLGHAVLELFDEQQAETVDRTEVGERVSGPVRFALKVVDLQQALERLLANGARLVHEPVTTPWGDVNVRVKDPDGFQVTLFEEKRAGG
jgi:catechol 2,3-dioxygenase-like lactoylglutathione lyase family enzyme